jgi:hypothetical protein
MTGAGALGQKQPTEGTCEGIRCYLVLCLMTHNVLCGMRPFHTLCRLVSRSKGRIQKKEKELRRVFGPRQEEVTGQCRKLHNEELRSL